MLDEPVPIKAPFIDALILPMLTSRSQTLCRVLEIPIHSFLSPGALSSQQVSSQLPIPSSHLTAPHHNDIAHECQEADADTTGIPRVEADADAKPGQCHRQSGRERERPGGTAGDPVCDRCRQEQQGEHQQRTYCQRCFADGDCQEHHKAQTQEAHRHTLCCCHVRVKRGEEQRTRDEEEEEHRQCADERDGTCLVDGDAQEVAEQHRYA